MERIAKYLLVTMLLVGILCSFAAAAVRPEVMFANNSSLEINNIELDSVQPPRFPVKKTHVTNQKDLEANPPADLRTPSNIKQEIEFDERSQLYIFRTKVGDEEIGIPYSLTQSEYMDYTLKQSMASYFKNKYAGLDANGKSKDEFSLKDIKLNLNPAEKIFGPGGVKLKANGYVEASMGLKYNKTDNPTLSERNRARTAFDFDEDIQMNVTASVGDKINFGMNYDTKAMFDFDSKKINLAYDANQSGDEDAILKRIEAGNISMTTTNSLINGGSALFGIGAELQFGKLQVRTIISQQESQFQSINSNGNIQTTNYEFKVDQYDQNRHFFLGHYFRDNYDDAMSKLPYVQSPINITRIEVWITNKKSDYTQSRNIVPFADIAEHSVIKNPKWIATGSADLPYNGANNLYSTITSSYTAARDISQVTTLFTGYLEGGQDYEKVESARLLNSSEYSYNPQLGYISLLMPLQADEVLAVAYEYKMNSKTYQVGEFSSDIVDKYDPGNPKSGALFVKMLKPVSLSPRAYTWDLMMKNVYDIGAINIQKDRFRLNISYQADTLGTYVNYISEGDIKNEMLLKVMNLDRLDARNNANPDGIFDFVDGYTIRAENGRIYFPVIEPFGSHLKKKINNSTIAEKYIYQELYDSTLTVARQIAEKNKFKISGTYRGSSNSAEINLGATNVPQGSVKVTANGMMLTEGVDYMVDYMSGAVTIINQNLIDSNAPIQVSLEDRTFSMQRRTLLGLNLSYDISKDFNIGGTIMHMYEKPLTTKTEIGNESVKNTLWGLNTSYKTQSQWLTNLVDKLPFVNATQPSQISLNAEFAHMIPGHYESKENGGYSYLDDFENSESRIDVKSPYAWTLAATPFDKSGTSLFPEAGLSNDIEYGKNRAMLSWFMIDGMFNRKNSSLTPQHIKNDKEQLSNHFVREILMRELYPNKDIVYNEAATIPALNLTYYPDERGPYNVVFRDKNNVTQFDQNGKLLKPETRWAGITRKMDVRDFESANIEYVEFWLMDPFVYSRQSANPNLGGEFYINLGEISEDVLKDGKKFYENGLPINDDPSAYEYTTWGKVPTRQSTVYAFDDNQGAAGRAKQDVGLNGLSTAEEFERDPYKAFVENYRNNLNPSVLDEMMKNPNSPARDPSGDNYHYYRGSDYDRDEVSILDRYKYYNGTEGNSPVTSETSESYSSASRNMPDVEDIDQDNTLNENETYFQYKIDLNPDMKVGDKYIVDSRTVKVSLPNGNDGEVTWYQFKVPVRNYDKRVGNIQDFKSIRFMRMFLTKFTQTTYLRFGTLQLVRGEWRSYEPTLMADESPSGKGVIDISTVNIEENSERKPVNYILPPGVSRVNDPDQTQLTKENEQSLSMRITNLDPKDARAIYKNTNYDLRRYKRIQLFTHAEKQITGTDIQKGELTVFMRLGTDYKNNYYEYEIPLSITPEGVYNANSSADREAVWPTGNMFDFPLELLKNVKLNRNKEKRKAGSTVSYTTLYSEYDPEKQNNKVSVKGNPSLAEVNVVMIGVRNNSWNEKSAEVWVNELRLTDFDEEGGWAAQGNLNIALSDLGSVSFSGRKETVGFGSIDQSLMERRSDDYQLYNISANVDIGRFLPEKAKLNIPFYYAYSNQKTTPKYDPFDKDVTLKESLGLVDTKAEKDSIKSLAVESNITKSVSFSNVKLNIKSKTPMPYDPANFSFGYTYSENEMKNPTTEYDKAQDYKASLSYSYSPLMKTWEPFKSVKGKSNSAKFAKSIGINYLPSNIAFNSNMVRYYTETMLRDVEGYEVGGSNVASRFLSWSQSFYWDRDFSLAWDFTKNLKASFQSGTRAEIEEPYLQVNKKMNRDAYDRWKDTVMQSIKNLGTPLEYRQIAKLTYQLPTRNIAVLDWITSNASYTGNYNWNRGAEIEKIEVGNVLNNNMTIDFNNRFELTRLYNKSDFLKKVNARFDASRKPQTQGRGQSAVKRAKPKRLTKTVMLSKDSVTTFTHGLDVKDIRVTAKRADSTSYQIRFKRLNNNAIRIQNKDSVQIQINIVEKVKDPNGKNMWTEVAEYSARGLMSFRVLTINFSKRKETYITGFRPSVGDAFGQKNTEFGLSPGLGFAFGLEGGEDFIEKSMDRDWLVINNMNITPAIFNNTDKFELKSQLEPFKGMKIELNASRENNKRTEMEYMYEGMPRTLGGSFSMTTVALSSALRSSNAKDGYHSDAFEKFLNNRNIVKQRLESKYRQTRYPSGGFMDENVGLAGQGYSPSLGAVDPNSGDVLIPAFIAAYTGRDASSISLSAFPSFFSMLPNWSASYEGLMDIALIKDKFKSLRLNHAYTCFYQVNSYESFSNWLSADTGDDLGYIRDVLSGKPVPSSPYNISSVSIAETFNPLFGVDGTLNNNMSFNMQYNNTRMLNLNMSAYQIVESLKKEFVVGMGYRIDEFNRVIGLTSKRARKPSAAKAEGGDVVPTSNAINNDLNLRLDLSHSTTQALIRKIEERFTQATSGVTIITLKFSADYTLSRSLTLRAFFDRIVNTPLVVAGSYPTTNSNFGVSVKFTLLQ